MKLYPHQEKALHELGNGKILCGGTGTGKSLTAAAYYVAKESPRDVYVITTAKKRDSLDWVKEFAAYAIGTTQDATVGGCLVVDSWNNIGNYEDIDDAFFIFDEQRLVGSGAWSKSFLKIAKRNRWILLSATPGDTWLDYIPVFVANGFYKNRTEFKRRHVVYNSYSKFPKVERFVGLNHLAKLRNSILVEMPYERHTQREPYTILVDYDKDLMEQVVKKRWHVYENRPIRDIAELFAVMRKVVNTDASRLEALIEIVSLHPRVIVFYNFDYELELLRTLPSLIKSRMQSRHPGGLTGMRSGGPQSLEREISDSTDQTSSDTSSIPSSIVLKTSSSSCETPVEMAEWNGHKHQLIPDTDRWIYLVQYIAGAEGWNCISSDTMVFWSLTYSWKNFDQAHGRIDRLNTPYSVLNYYTLQSNSLIDNAVAKALSQKRNFNEARFVENL